MISMRYGCIPIARATGGLADTIQDFHASPPGSGFLYSGNDPSDLSKAVLDALAVFHNKTAWQALQKNAMSLDYSWEKSAEKYFALYNQLTRNM
jgi:starch synthase